MYRLVRNHRQPPTSPNGVRRAASSQFPLVVEPTYRFRLWAPNILSQSIG